jgi:hypothetical protein
MSVLLKFLTASKVADLPPVAQQYFTDDEEFIDDWAGLDDVSKYNDIATYLATCVEMRVKTDTEIARLMALCIQGRKNEYDEEKEEDKPEEEQVVEVPVLAVVPAPAPAPAPAPKKPRVKSNPDEPKRPRGRPTTNTDGCNRCKFCGINLASSGSLFNHYDSKAHQARVLRFLEKAPSQLCPEKKYKVVVILRKHDKKNELGLTQENPDEGTFLDLKDYVGGANPIKEINLQCETEVWVENSRPDLWKDLPPRLEKRWKPVFFL